jgi:ankyrin repeat protein
MTEEHKALQDKIQKNILQGLPCLVDVITYIENGGDVNFSLPNDWGNTLLTTCIKHQYYDIVMLLLRNAKELKLNVNKKSLDGATSISMLVGKRGVNKDDENLIFKIAKMMFNLGCNVNVKNRSGSGPLTFAIWNMNVEMVRLLLENGAVVEEEDYNSLDELKNHINYFPIRNLLDKYAGVDE